MLLSIWLSTEEQVEEPEEEMDLTYMARIVNKTGIKVVAHFI